MTLLIDTGEFAEHERMEALRAAMSTTEIPHLYTHAGADGHVRHRLEAWDVGSGSRLVQLGGTAIRLQRGPLQLKTAAPERVALGIQLNNAARRTHLGIQETFEVGDLVLTDLTALQDYSWAAGGGCRTYNGDYQKLGLRVDEVRRAIPCLKRSPLYSMVQGHFIHLSKVSDDVAASPAASMLGAATAEMLRALVVSAWDNESGGQREVLHSTLQQQTKHFIECHLTDPKLDVTMIAAAHHVSVRRVYQAWAGSELPLSQWVIRARLEGARRELARPGRAQSVAVVARRWGFIDPGHFARRFRGEYGMTPREWQRMCAPVTPPTC